MIASLGYSALAVALAISVFAALASLLGARKGFPELVASSRNGVIAVFGLTSLAVATLLLALITHRFELAYVASYTSRDMSPVYVLTALWAGNEGSLLLWAWLLSLCSLIVIFRNRDRHVELLPYVTSVVMFTQAFFLILLVFVSDPFKSLASPVADGRGLNPLLENLMMVFHPPALLAGYVGFTIPFAFALAALAANSLEGTWVVAIRRWAIVSWLFLGVGNLLGAQWAYVELGWGGYWAWDPVENAGLMPWLMGTAFLHSVMMQKRRDMLRVWNMVLVVLTFVLCIFGTFLTRSGILSSVHSFGDLGLGSYFVVYIVLTLAASLWLIAKRSGALRSAGDIDSLVSRESAFLLNNVVLVSATFAVLWGTVFPLIAKVTQGTEVSVTSDYFNRVVGPVFFVLLILLGLCTLTGWRKISTAGLLRRLILPSGSCIALIVVLALFGIRPWYVVAAFAVCLFVLVGIVTEWLNEVRVRRRVKRVGYLGAFWGLFSVNRARYGAYIVHLGVVLMAVGIIGSSFFQVEKTASMGKGETLSIGSYTLTYQGLSVTGDEARQIVSATLSVVDGGRSAGFLVSEKYFHKSYEQPVTEVAIRSTWKEDLYVILAGWSGSTATFKVLVNPMVIWLWTGGGMLLIGTLLALWPKVLKRASLSSAAGEDGEG